MGGREGRHALPRPLARSAGWTVHRLPHRHSCRRSRPGLRALPPDPVPAHLLPPRLGARRLRGSGGAVRPRRRRLRPAATRDQTSRAGGVAGARGGRDLLPGRPRDLRGARAVPAHRRRYGRTATSAASASSTTRPPAAAWEPWRFDGFERRDTGIAAATDGLASVVAVRPTERGGPSGVGTAVSTHDAELLFYFVLHGAVTVSRPGEPDEPLGVSDSVAIPAAQPFALGDCSADLELLEVALPAGFHTTPAGPGPPEETDRR